MFSPVDRATIAILAGLGVITLIGLAAIMRPLIFASLQPELAEARGVSLRTVSMAFLAIVALAVSACAQIVGVLLVFTLMVGPPAAAQPRDDEALERAPARRSAGSGGSLVRHRDRVLRGLAGQLLHRHAERDRLFFLPGAAS